MLVVQRILFDREFRHLLVLTFEDADYDEIQKERIAELKRSLLNIKQNNNEEVSNQTEEQETLRPTYQNFSMQPHQKSASS